MDAASTIARIVRYYTHLRVFYVVHTCVSGDMHQHVLCLGSQASRLPSRSHPHSGERLTRKNPRIVLKALHYVSAHKLSFLGHFSNR